MPSQQAWNLLAFGLFCSAFGTLTQFFLLCKLGSAKQREESFNDVESLEVEKQEVLNDIVYQQNPIDADQLLELNDLREKNHLLNQEKNLLQKDSLEKQEEINSLYRQHEELHQKLQSTLHEYERYKLSVADQISMQEKLVQDCQKTISDQRESIDKKLQQIAQLETKVSDLTYEIKTLIQLAEIENQTVSHYTPPAVTYEPEKHSLNWQETEEEIFCLPEKKVKNADQASIQLKRCIDIAQKITGASYYNSANSRFKDLTVDNYALDLRRLYENLRTENASTLILYSQKEHKILFVNNQSKNLLGWSPDKFVQSFHDIIEPSYQEWKESIASLSIKNESYMSLKMKSKSGYDVEVQSLLGIIPTGIFRNHILGVLYNPTS